MDTGVVMFVCSFRLVVEWILLQFFFPQRPRDPVLAKILIIRWLALQVV